MQQLHARGGPRRADSRHPLLFLPQAPAPPPPPPPPPQPTPSDAGIAVTDVLTLIALLRELQPAQPAACAPALAPPPPVAHTPLHQLPPGAWTTGQLTMGTVGTAHSPPPPHSNATRVVRSLMSATYLRRLFVTRDLSAILGVVPPPRQPTIRRQAAPGETLRPLRVDADPLPEVPLTVLDEHDRLWRIAYSPRRLSPATGRLATGWSKLCASMGAVVFERLVTRSCLRGCPASTRPSRLRRWRPPRA